MGAQVQNFKNILIKNELMNSSGGIYSSEVFRFILELERARADRTGHIFSLVIFRFNHDIETNKTSLDRLEKALVEKIRMSDEIGWYDKEISIGALLPGTSAEGACQFIDIIKERIGDIGSSLVSTIYTYPYPFDISKSFKKAADERDPFPLHTSSKNISAECSSMPTSNGRSVKSMEVLFARPIPRWKRMIDILVAILMFATLLPIFLLIALFIKIVSPGPVLYRQERIGHLGRKFTFWKFRTMHMNIDENIHLKHISRVIEKDSQIGKLDDFGDDRIIPMGRVLRKLCLDELPQLWNVLLGDMSLIGPRPCMDYEAKKFLPWQNRRFDVLPGMSGLWQVSGKNRTTFKEMLRLDIRYSRRLSPVLDIKILLLTVPAIFGMAFDSFSKKMAIDRKSPTLVSPRRDLSPHR